jgi:hypothetical protein
MVGWSCRMGTDADKIASPNKLATMQRRPDEAHRSQAVPGSMRARQAKKRSEPKQLLSLFSAPGLPTLSSADSLSAEPSTSPHRPVYTGNLQMQDALSRVREEDSRGGVWDADFASDITLAQIQSQSGLQQCSLMLTVKVRRTKKAETDLPRTRSVPHARRLR